MPTSTLCLDRLVLDKLLLQADGCEIRIGQLQVTAPRLALEGARLRSLQAAEARFDAVDIVLPPAALARWQAPGDNTPRWQLEPLAELEGRVEAFITDAHWTIDADVEVPISDGRIDFNRVTVSHIGPDSTMGVSPMGVHVDAPGGRTYLYTFAIRHVPGVRFEQRGGSLFGARASDHGMLEIRPFIEAVLDGIVKGAAPHAAASQLDRTRMTGELQLGDGRAGTDQFSLQLIGRAQGMNRLSVSAAVVGHEVAARLPELCATHATLALPGGRARCAGIRGAASMRLRPDGITLHADDLIATDISIEQGPA